MAWETINHKCGHESRTQMYGPYKDRERKAAWMATQPCSSCVQAARDAQNAAVAEQAAAQGLPSLQGSPKQIAWAENIRTWALRALDTRADELSPAGKQAIELAKADILAHADAAWWIDNRGHLADSKTIGPILSAETQAKIRERNHEREKDR